MNRSLFRMLVVVALLVFSGQITNLYADAGKNDEKKLAELSERLQNLTSDLDAVEKQIAQKNKEYLQFQHDIVYTNSEPAVIYAEIKAMEKELVEKRKALNEATMRVPGAREMLNQRRILYDKKRNLAERMELLSNEIYALRLRAGSTDQVPEEKK